jgi:hypothetical protein
MTVVRERPYGNNSLPAKLAEENWHLPRKGIEGWCAVKKIFCPLMKILLDSI